MTFWGRVLRVSVAGIGVTDARITVNIELTSGASQDTGTVDLYNLNPARESHIRDHADAIVVEGGHRATFGLLFAGRVQRVRRVRSTSGGVSHITRIHLGDQTRANVRRAVGVSAVTSRSYAGAQPVRAIAADLAGDLGLLSGPFDAIPAEATVLDWTFAGSTVDGLNQLLGTVDAGWYDDDGQLRVRRRGLSEQPDRRGLLLTPETGLIRTPAVTDEGAEVTMWLNPGLRRGTRVRVRSASLQGDWSVVGLRHQADNWTGPFITWADLRAA